MNKVKLFLGILFAISGLQICGATSILIVHLPSNALNDTTKVVLKPVFKKIEYLGLRKDSVLIFETLEPGYYQIKVKYKKTELNEEIAIFSDTEIFIIPNYIQYANNDVFIQIVGQKENHRRLLSIENFGIYEGKKNDVIQTKNLIVNQSNNCARQIFGKIAGLNIWESDQGGLQLGIGGRGLNPNRSSNFNLRQNGYDISADALGYPESYFTPPIEAVEKIEMIRGAASLQYGTQFGGMVNYRIKSAPRNKPIESVNRISYGSWNYINTFNSLAANLLKEKLSIYTYFNYKQGNGFRSNSNFDANTYYLNLTYRLSNKVQWSGEITKMKYLAQQAGGLTDRAFAENPKQSVRNRNWFFVDWFLWNSQLNIQFDKNIKLNSTFFGLNASRKALGNLERINILDLGGNRTLIHGRFENVGNETRLLIAKGHHHILIGSRVYHGASLSEQGEGNANQNANFAFLNPLNLENSSYQFKNNNAAFFSEILIHVNKKLKIVPGVRAEWIRTAAHGFYKTRIVDAAGSIIAEHKKNENLTNPRHFIIAGLGASYDINADLNLYVNFSQNYRAINYSDMRIQNPNFVIDSNLKDERGHTADIGFRGRVNKNVKIDISFFWLEYKGKIGQILKADKAPLYLDYRFRTNVADARVFGFESLLEYTFWKSKNSNHFIQGVQGFGNLAYTWAEYRASQFALQNGKMVEMVPQIVLRSGLEIMGKRWIANTQFSYVSQHFSDATNAIRTASAIEGEIQAYYLLDISARYAISKKWSLEFSVNNVLNRMYYTRRAEGYPGPGIIPGDGRAFYVTLQFRI